MTASGTTLLALALTYSMWANCKTQLCLCSGRKMSYFTWSESLATLCGVSETISANVWKNLIQKNLFVRVQMWFLQSVLLFIVLLTLCVAEVLRVSEISAQSGATLKKRSLLLSMAVQKTSRRENKYYLFLFKTCLRQMKNPLASFSSFLSWTRSKTDACFGSSAPHVCQEYLILPSPQETTYSGTTTALWGEPLLYTNPIVFHCFFWLSAWMFELVEGAEGKPGLHRFGHPPTVGWRVKTPTATAVQELLEIFF